MAERRDDRKVDGGIPPNASDLTAAYQGSEPPTSDQPPIEARSADTVGPTCDFQPTVKPPTQPARPPAAARTRSRGADVAGRRFGDYELLEEIARGGMGVVYKARQQKLNRIVAIKMILQGQFASDEHVQRFYSEAEAAANLDHPGIVPIYEVQEQDGQHFFSMGYVDGASLASHVRSGPLPPRDAAQLTRHIAEAIHYAHQHGVVHRDLKPGNILITSDGQPRVTDFGLAKSVEGDSGLTATGQVLGTPSYMPPEQAAGRVEDVGPRSDIYSLGAILYCLLTGRPPFQAASPVETIRQVLDGHPPLPRVLNPAVDRDLETVCLKCLEKDARNRYATAQELADELQRWLGGEPIRARRIGVVARGYRWCRRKPTVAALILAVPMMLLTAAAAVAFWYSGQQTRQLGRLDNQFQIGLDQAELSDAYLERMESLLAEIEQLAAGRAATQRTRLLDRFGDRLLAEIRRAKPTEQNIADLEVLLARLEVRDLVRAEQLRDELRQRMPQWLTVFELDRSAEVLAQVMDSNEIIVQDDAVVRQARGGQSELVRTRFACHGEIELVAIYGSDWRQQGELALLLNESRQDQYRFALRPAAFQRSANENEAVREAGASFASVDLAEGEFQLTIFRNDAPLLRQSIPAVTVPAGRLTFRARREQGLLTVQLNSDRPFSVRDPFPLSSREPGVFAVHWPAGLSLQALRATRRAAGQAANDMERGDELYSQGELVEALAFYQRESTAGASNAIRREANYKAGRCLAELDRRSEAADLFHRVFREEADDWAPLAGCQLWLLMLEDNRADDADAVFELLQSHFSDGQLGAMVPQATRERILDDYLRGITTVSSMLRYDPQRLRNIQRAAAVDRLLSHDGIGDVMLQIEVLRALRLAGDLETALPIAERLARQSGHWNASKTYSRLLRQTDRADQALHEVTRAIEAYRTKHGESWVLRVERARVLAALGRWGECVRELDDVLINFETHQREPLGRGPSVNDYLPAALMRGFLYERAGDTAAAQRVWSDAFRVGEIQLSKSNAVTSDTAEVLILGSLTDHIRDEQIDRITGLIFGGEHSPLVMMVRGLFNRDTLLEVMRDLWKDPVARPVAEAIAFESESFRERVRMPLILAGRRYLQISIAPQGWASGQGELAMDLTQRLHSEFVEYGTFSTTQSTQLALTWKGTTGILGWGGVKGTLDPEMRGPLSYALAHRFLRRGDQQAAVSFFQQAIDDTGEETVPGRLARSDLEMLRANEGMLVVRSNAPRRIELIVRKQDEDVATVGIEVGDEAELRLPPGSYQLKLSDEPELAIQREAISITTGSRSPVQVQWRWRPADEPEAVAGAVDRPTLSLQLGRWQVVPAFDNSMVSVRWGSDSNVLLASLESGGWRAIDASDGRLIAAVSGEDRNICLEVNPGRTLLAEGGQGHVRLWELPQVQTRGIYRDLRDIHSIAFSPDGRRFAAGSWDAGLAIWSIAGRLERKIPEAKPAVLALAFSPDSNWLVSGHNDSETSVRVWNVATGELVRTLPGTPRTVTRLAWHPDQPLLAVGGLRNDVQIWKADPWEMKHAVRGGPEHAGTSDVLHWMPDGQRLATASQGAPVWLWNFSESSDEPVAILNDSHTVGRTWNPDSSQLAGFQRQAQIRIADEQGNLLRTLGAELSEPTDMRCHPSADLVAVVGKHPSLRILEISGTVIHELPGLEPLERVEWSGDGQLLAAANSRRQMILAQWDGRELTVSAKLSSGGIRSLAWRPGTHELMAGYQDGRIRTWSASGSEVRPAFVASPEAIRALAWSSDGERLFAGDEAGNLHVFGADGSAVAPARQLPHRSIRWLGSQPGGTKVACVFDHPQLVIIDAEGPAGNDESPLLSVPARSAAWSRDGQSVRLLRDGGSIHSWQPGQTGVSRHGRTVHDAVKLELFADDRQVTLVPRRQVLAWGSASGQVERTTVLLPKGFATFSAAGRLLAATPDFEDECRYIVRQPAGHWKPYTPAAFHKLIGQPLPAGSP